MNNLIKDVMINDYAKYVIYRFKCLPHENEFILNIPNCSKDISVESLEKQEILFKINYGLENKKWD